MHRVGFAVDDSHKMSHNFKLDNFSYSTQLKTPCYAPTARPANRQVGFRRQVPARGLRNRLEIGPPILALQLYQYVLLYSVLPLFYCILRIYLFFLRLRVVGEEVALGCLSDYGRVVVAVWHQRFLPALGYVTKFRHFRPIVMISQSKDGELAARLAKKLGLVPVRGSSSRGGTTALLAIKEALKKNRAVVHIVDGPRGPKGVVKPGLVSIAQMSGAVILPVIVSAEKAWIARSWDQFMIPKPFSRVTIEWGQPFFAPRHIDRDRFEEMRRDVEISLSRGHADADLRAGWKQPL